MSSSGRRPNAVSYAPQRGPQPVRVGERLGEKVDVGGVEVAGRGPEPVAVHRRDPGAPAGRGVELGEERVGVGALTDEVVRGESLLPWGLGGQPGGFEQLRSQRDDGVEEAQPGREPRVAERQVVGDDPAEVPADDDAALVAEDVVDECVQVHRVGRDVVEAVRGEVGVADAAQVGGDDLEARGGERPDVAPPDPLRLRIAVHEQQGHAAGVLVHERQVHPVAHLDPTDVERVRVRGAPGGRRGA